MIPVISRIIARYVSGGLMTIGVLSPDLASEFAMDPDVALVLGGIIGAATEAVYAWAKKKGLAT
jgi:hypothetical protein